MSLTYQRLSAENVEELFSMFQRIVASGMQRHFHPHPFTREQAEILCHHGGRDVYCAQFFEGTMVGYGMLRGWDAGFSTPSLGIVIDPSAQGRGLGRALMLHLHALAREAGVADVRLKVYHENVRACRLYASLGYVFTPGPEGQQIGLLRL